MTHLLVIEGEDTDPTIAYPCTCEANFDHGPPAYGDEPECSDCGAILTNTGLCWYCDRNWIWTDQP